MMVVVKTMGKRKLAEILGAIEKFLSLSSLSCFDLIYDVLMYVIMNFIYL